MRQFLELFPLAGTDSKLEEQYAQARKKLIDAVLEGKANNTVSVEVLRLVFVDYFLRVLHLVFVFNDYKAVNLLEAGAYAMQVRTAAVTLVKFGTEEFHCVNTARGISIGQALGFESFTPENNPVYETIASGLVALHVIQGDIRHLIIVTGNAANYEKGLRQATFYLVEQHPELKAKLGELKVTTDTVAGREYIRNRLTAILSANS